MEDGCYVSLSLEKYNELYDKAKKYDELFKEEQKGTRICNMCKKTTYDYYIHYDGAIYCKECHNKNEKD